ISPDGHLTKRPRITPTKTIPMIRTVTELLLDTAAAADSATFGDYCQYIPALTCLDFHFKTTQWLSVALWFAILTCWLFRRAGSIGDHPIDCAPRSLSWSSCLLR
ncbi:MAG: hypothetical protein DLM68_18335, partial [Hyphomicrobiales bacterium]